MEIQNKKTENVKIIAYLLFAIILLCVVLGCGSRRVSKSKTETKETQTTEATFKDSSKTVTILGTNTKIVDISQSDELVITPIDSGKEFSVNGIKYKGVILKAKKVRNNITTDKTENVSQIKQNDVKTALKNETAKEAIIDTKKSDRGFNYFSLLWLLLIIPIYLLWKRCRVYF